MRGVKTIAAIAEQVVHRKSEPPAEESKALIPSGSTLMNLACSGRTYGAFKPGSMINLIGDSNSGKTILALTMFAEMARDEQWAEYSFLYDDVEAANCFDIPKLFGKGVVGKLELLQSSTIEEFEANILRRLQGNKPFIYILDSLDALTDEDEEERGRKLAEGKQVTGGSYATKAKTLKKILRMIVRELLKSKSLLVIISQTIDNIGGGPWSPKKTRAGGNALRFFALHEMWLSLGEKIKAKDRVIGIETKLKVERSKLTGKTRTVSFNIFYDYGVDDIGSCVAFMTKEGFWKEKGQKICATELGVEMTERKLIEHIEAKGLESKLRRAVGKAWNEIEDSIRLDRKAKYS